MHHAAPNHTSPDLNTPLRAAVGGICPKCHIRLPSQLVSDLWKTDAGLPCQQCRVLLCAAPTVVQAPEVAVAAPKVAAKVARKAPAKVAKAVRTAPAQAHPLLKARLLARLQNDTARAGNRA